mgnify:CR=1 FL=1
MHCKALSGVLREKFESDKGETVLPRQGDTSSPAHLSQYWAIGKTTWARHVNGHYLPQLGCVIHEKQHPT